MRTGHISQGPRNRFSYVTFVAGLVFGTITAAGTVSDTDKEERWAEQIVDQLVDGETYYLEAAKYKFLAILTEANDPKGGIILVHGSGVHPDWPDVIHPLRVGLPEHGWTTVSIQMPLPPSNMTTDGFMKLADEAALRYQASIALTRNYVDGPLFIVTHSISAAYALYFLVNNHSEAIDGIVTVAMNAVYKKLPAKLHPVATLPRLRVAVLDLYGEADFRRRKYVAENSIVFLVVDTLHAGTCNRVPRS